MTISTTPTSMTGLMNPSVLVLIEWAQPRGDEPERETAPARNCVPDSRALAVRADQHLDLPIALRARLGGVIALRALGREAAHLHAVGRDAGPDQRATHIADTLL